jgi:hypothetical protein
MPPATDFDGTTTMPPAAAFAGALGQGATEADYEPDSIVDIQDMIEYLNGQP